MNKHSDRLTFDDANAISTSWLRSLALDDLVAGKIAALGVSDLATDVVAIGKASREMAAAATAILGSRLKRSLVICDSDSARRGAKDASLVVGEHPRPGPGSLHAGTVLVEFLRDSRRSECTLFLISGGASSLCALPQAPLGLDDLGEIWNVAVASGTNITVLNKLRAATSAIAGGAVLRAVRTPRSVSLVLVDNVISGAEWVASGLTYDFRPLTSEVQSLIDEVKLDDADLASRILEASRERDAVMSLDAKCNHVNAVVGEPSMMLTCAIDEASRRGYRVHSLGAHLHGDVADAVALFTDAVHANLSDSAPFCVIGVGEVTVQVRGSGSGGRCQEFAWRLARELNDCSQECTFVARASDGRDYLEGVAGAWVDTRTINAAQKLGIDWDQIVNENDSHHALDRLGQVLPGGHTGWNLCDLYVACVGTQ